MPNPLLLIHFQLVLLLTQYKSPSRDLYMAILLSFSAVRFVVFSVLSTVFLPFLLDFLIVGTCLCPHYNCTALVLELESWEKRANAALLMQADYLKALLLHELPDNCPLGSHWFSPLYRICVSREWVEKWPVGLELLHGTEAEEWQVWLCVPAVDAVRCCTHLSPEVTSVLLWEMVVGISWLQGLLSWLIDQRFNTVKIIDVQFFQE